MPNIRTVPHCTANPNRFSSRRFDATSRHASPSKRKNRSSSSGDGSATNTFAIVELGYARVSTAKQDLDRQIETLLEVGIARDRIYVDKKSGATVDRPGLRAVLEYAREGDVIVVRRP